MFSKIPPHLEVDPKTGYTFSKFAKFPYNQPLPREIQNNIAKCIRSTAKDGPFTRALKRKSQLREMTTAIAEKAAIIAKKAALLPKELLKKIKL